MGGGYTLSGADQQQAAQIRKAVAQGGIAALPEAVKAAADASIPQPAPDLTDEAIRAASLRGLGAIGQGRKSTFLTGPAGTAAPTTQRKTLLGG